MSMRRLNRYCILLLVSIVVLALVALPGCSKVKEKAKDAAGAALNVVEKGAEIAGDATASWLGKTAGNVGKNFNETIIERFAYLEISIDEVNIIEAEAEEAEADEDVDEEEVDEEVEEEVIDDGIIRYSIELTLNNKAPHNEKLYVNILLGDHYLVACDQDDYTYSLTVDRSAYSYYDQILPGKSKLTVCTELSEPAELSYLLYIGNKIRLP